MPLAVQISKSAIAFVVMILAIGVGSYGPSYGGTFSTDRVSRILSTQGFSGPLEGTEGLEKIEIIHFGELTSGESAFHIYVHRYYRRLLGGTATRSTKRLLVISSEGTNLGGYTLDEEPDRISGPDVVFDIPSNAGNRFTFTEKGPPDEAWFDGAVRTLYK